MTTSPEPAFRYLKSDSARYQSIVARPSIPATRSHPSNGHSVTPVCAPKDLRWVRVQLLVGSTLPCISADRPEDGGLLTRAVHSLQPEPDAVETLAEPGEVQRTGA